VNAGGRAGGDEEAPRPRAVLAVASAIHFVHDGFSDLVYVLLPIWARDLGLSFAQAGILRGGYVAGLAGFQIPAGLMAERRGERGLLAAGTAVTGLGFLAAGTVGGFATLLSCLVLAGLGSAVQHPLSSSLVSRAYETGPRRLALGTYNFSGDLGKVAVPATAALLIPWIGWRGAAQGYALVGLGAALGIALILGRLHAGRRPDGTAETAAGTAGPESAGWGIKHGHGFLALSAIHVIDNGTRSGFLTFLPFLLIPKGSTVPGVGMALMLVFLGGAFGKLACGALAERIGVIRTVLITEVATGAGILSLLGLPLETCLALLPALGIALNGTSSVLYGSVADLVDVGRRSRGYGVFYTVGIGASSVAPVVYGVLSDWGGVRVALATVGAVVLLTVPLALALRRTLESGLGLARA
jgi:MFS family permease